MEAEAILEQIPVWDPEDRDPALNTVMAETGPGVSGKFWIIPVQDTWTQRLLEKAMVTLTYL